ncbi:hypothetical protein DF152_17335 [Burkholderia cenocepacia]|nr:hypothetical protein DF152_17335 [Burkholderia cenocepacia]
MISTTVTDDFGNALDVVRDLSIDAMNANIRTVIECMWEGIASGVLSGNVDESCLRFFGLVA